MEKVLQELSWAPIPFKGYQNTPGCGTGGSGESRGVASLSKLLILAFLKTRPLLKIGN